PDRVNDRINTRKRDERETDRPRGLGPWSDILACGKPEDITHCETRRTQCKGKNRPSRGRVSEPPASASTARQRAPHVTEHVRHRARTSPKATYVMLEMVVLSRIDTSWEIRWMCHRGVENEEDSLPTPDSWRRRATISCTRLPTGR